MAKKNKWLQRTLLASALLMAGPLSSASAAVVTSIRPLGFIASAIADGVTPTEVLLPDGASPHDFALRPSDIQRLRSADLVLWVGPGHGSVPEQGAGAYLGDPKAGCQRTAGGEAVADERRRG